MNKRFNSIIIEIGQGLKLIKDKKSIRVCNFSDNYYGDQHCIEIEHLKLDRVINKP